MEKLSVDAISSVTSSQTQNTQASGNSQVSKLIQLEQTVKSTESSFRKKAKQNGLSENEIESRTEKYDRLIAQIEQQIREVKAKRAKHRAAVHRSSGVTASHRTEAPAAPDYSGLSVTALETSYLSLPFPSVDAVATLEVLQPAESTVEAAIPQKLDSNV